MTTQEILEAARGAKAALALADSAARAQALHSMAAQLCSPDSMTAILAANADDMAAAKGHISEVMLDRLALTEERIRAMAKGIEEVAALPDPVGRVLKRVERPERTGDRKGRRAHGCDRHHLREPPQRHQRCRGTGRQERQRLHPAKREGGVPLLPTPSWQALKAGHRGRRTALPENASHA